MQLNHKLKGVGAGSLMVAGIFIIALSGYFMTTLYQRFNASNPSQKIVNTIEQMKILAKFIRYEIVLREDEIITANGGLYKISNFRLIGDELLKKSIFSNQYYVLINLDNDEISTVYMLSKGGNDLSSINMEYILNLATERDIGLVDSATFVRFRGGNEKVKLRVGRNFKNKIAYRVFDKNDAKDDKKLSKNKLTGSLNAFQNINMNGNAIYNLKDIWLDNGSSLNNILEDIKLILLRR